jgi:hypothetical protein
LTTAARPGPVPDLASDPPSAAFPVPDVLRYLAGRWRVSRTVRDLAGGHTGLFEGYADFTPDSPTSLASPDSADRPGNPSGPDTLAHAESGDFTWRGVTRPAHREHRFTRGLDGTAEVAFADGRPFHDLDLRTGRWTAEHGCDPDRYVGEFTVLDADHWQVVWSVTGPAKRLVLATVHRRL